MKCKGCEAYGDYGCRAGFTSIVINGEMGCEDADRCLDAFHFNQVKDKTKAGMTVYPSREHHKHPTISRADNIRAMDDEELAEFLQEPHCNRISDDDCKNKYLANCTACWLDWLRQEEEA